LTGVETNYRKGINFHRNYFQFTQSIRTLIYTTNTVEDYHRQIRKVTKNKAVFPSDESLEKLVYLAYRNIAIIPIFPPMNFEFDAKSLTTDHNTLKIKEYSSLGYWIKISCNSCGTVNTT